MTVIELIEAQAARLKKAGVAFGHGTTNAFDEAAWLVLHALKMPYDASEKDLARAVSPAEQAEAEALVGRRIDSRLPAAYLTKEVWLQNVPFYVDERSIVPRSYIAELLADGEQEGILDAWLTDQTHLVLDLCTGNGSLAVIAALAFPEVQVDAADISEDALAIARINVERHQLGKRVRVLQSDLFSQLPGAYDLIVCNPPYVNDASMAKLPAEFQAEPALALAGGKDGMDIVRRILADALAHLRPAGVLVLEVGHERKNFERAFKQLEVAWLDTSSGSDKVVLVTREALERAQASIAKAAGRASGGAA